MTSGRARPSAIFERADCQICFRKWHEIYTFNSLAFNYFKSRILPKARFLSDMAAGASPKRTNKRFEPGVDSAPPVSSLSLFCADKFSAINLVVERDAGGVIKRKGSSEATAILSLYFRDPVVRKLIYYFQPLFSSIRNFRVSSK